MHCTPALLCALATSHFAPPPLSYLVYAPSGGYLVPVGSFFLREPTKGATRTCPRIAAGLLCRHRTHTYGTLRLCRVRVVEVASCLLRAVGWVGKRSWTYLAFLHSTELLYRTTTASFQDRLSSSRRMRRLPPTLPLRRRRRRRFLLFDGRQSYRLDYRMRAASFSFCKKRARLRLLLGLVVVLVSRVAQASDWQDCSISPEDGWK